MEEETGSHDGANVGRKMVICSIDGCSYYINHEDSSTMGIQIV